MTPTLPPRALAEHRRRIENEWSLDRGQVLIASGLPVPIPGSDQPHEFYSHAEHTWLAGREPIGEVLAFDPDMGWTLFAPVPTEEQRFWLGDLPDHDELEAATGIERVLDRALLADWLAEREDEPLALLGAEDIVTAPRGYNLPPWDTSPLTVSPRIKDRLRAGLDSCRRVKDQWELDLMRKAAAASCAGHRLMMEICRPGMTERILKAEIEAEFVRHGAVRSAYHTIVGGGPNGAVLHSTPTDRPVEKGELVLIDAGAEYGGYMSDITRTFPVGSPTAEQKDLIELVLAVEQSAIRRTVPGAEYREIHLEACVELARGLVDFGLLRGNPESLVERDAHAIFFPHGIGHMIGLCTHDVGGYAEGREPSKRFGLKYLRADLRLEPGHVVTIEPGVYFIPALLANVDRWKEYKDEVNWDMARRMFEFGGIRIEDNVHVTPEGPEVLTAALSHHP